MTLIKKYNKSVIGHGFADFLIHISRVIHNVAKWLLAFQDKKYAFW